MGDLHEQVSGNIIQGLLWERTLGMVRVTQTGQISTASIANNNIQSSL